MLPFHDVSVYCLEPKIYLFQETLFLKVYILLLTLYHPSLFHLLYLSEEGGSSLILLNLENRFRLLRD